MFERRGWEVWTCPGRGGRVDLSSLARRAAETGLVDLLVEPGPELTASFLQRGPVDEILLFLAPKVLGGGHGWTQALPPRLLERAIELASRCPAQSLGDDLLLRLAVPDGRAIGPPARNGIG